MTTGTTMTGMMMTMTTGMMTRTTTMTMTEPQPGRLAPAL